jgi:hypothetical protein
VDPSAQRPRPRAHGHHARGHGAGAHALVHRRLSGRSSRLPQSPGPSSGRSASTGRSPCPPAWRGVSTCLLTSTNSARPPRRQVRRK